MTDRLYTSKVIVAVVVVDDTMGVIFSQRAERRSDLSNVRQAKEETFVNSIGHLLNLFHALLFESLLKFVKYSDLRANLIIFVNRNGARHGNQIDTAFSDLHGLLRVQAQIHEGVLDGDHIEYGVNVVRFDSSSARLTGILRDHKNVWFYVT